MGTIDIGQLLVSLQLSDSAFPSGFYTMSHGLEGFQQAGLAGADDIGLLLEDILVHSVGPGDATALARAHDAARQHDWDGVELLDHVLFATKLNAEMRTASVRSGRQLVDLASEIFDTDGITEYAKRVKSRAAPGCQPIVTGVCSAEMDVDVHQAVVADLFAFSASFVGAALRMRLSDHRSAQVLLHELGGVLEQVANDAVARSADEIGGFVPMADICSAQHERADARLFTS